MLVIDSGMATLLRLSHPAKHPVGISVIELESVTVFKDMQFKYLQPIITQYFIGNKSEIWSLSLMVHSKRRRFNAFIDS